MKIYSFILLFLLSASVYFTETVALSAMAAPNESIIEGVVYEYSVTSSKLLDIEPEQTLYGLTVLIENSNALKGPDMFKAKKGKPIRLLSKEKIPPGFFGKKIKAKASMRGDERGKTFWIYDIEAIK